MSTHKQKIFVDKDYDRATDLCDAILDWADGVESFDTAFVISVRDKILTFGNVTPKQLAALENIAEKFNIEV